MYLDSLDSSLSLATTPWWDLYLPALCGERVRVAEALGTVEAARPGARDEAAAVGVRALLVLGRDADADALWRRLVGRSGREIDALATWMCEDGLAVALRRHATEPLAGLRADAACDAAALTLRAGDPDAARAHVRAALATCPGHGEALRWERLLSDPQDSVRAAALAAGRGVPDPCDPVAIDVLELIPRRRNGWIAEERLRRRVVHGTPVAAWSPEASGLGRLQHRGVVELLFAVEDEYDTLAADHPLVALECLADVVRGRVHTGRPSLQAARACLEDAEQIDDIARDDASNLLVALATQDPTLRGLGWALADRMVRQERRDAPWRAYRAWFGAQLGRPDATDDARQTLRDPAACSTTTWLAAAALEATCGRAALLEALDAYGGRADHLVVRAALARGPLRAPRCFVSPRLAPRGREAAS